MLPAWAVNLGTANGVQFSQISYADGPVTPPNFTDILFSNPSANDAIIQYDHPNERAASNQCARRSQ